MKAWITRAVLIGTALARTMLAESPRRFVAWFPDGAGLEIYTESTGGTQVSMNGEIGIGPGGVHNQDMVNRVVTDSGNNILFAYNLEASRGHEPDTVTIRILPLSSTTEENFLKRAGKPGQLRFSGSHIPTVSAVREFPGVKIGQAVNLQTLYSPSTGEKIYDVLSPIAGPPASALGGMMVTTRPTRDEISLKEIRLTVNGQSIVSPPATITGGAARIDIPGHGSFILTAYDPRSSAPGYAFSLKARVEGKTVRWTMDGDNVEITSEDDVLARTENGMLWVYHDPNYRSSDQPDVVGMRAADRVEWLLPKK